MVASPEGRTKKFSKDAKQNPVPTVDIIVRKKGNSKNDDNDCNEILLETRARPPFINRYCIPGGHVDYGETVEHAALRELHEETSIKARLATILGVYSDPKRDPRGQRISTVFVADWVSGLPRASDDARTANWFSENEIMRLHFFAFDHRKILQDYLKWNKIRRGSKMTSFETSFWSSKK